MARVPWGPTRRGVVAYEYTDDAITAGTGSKTKLCLAFINVKPRDKTSRTLLGLLELVSFSVMFQSQVYILKQCLFLVISS